MICLKIGRLSWILFLIILTISLSSCTDEVTKPDCEINKCGWVTISNNSKNPYDFYIDDVFQSRLNGGSITKSIKINEGNNRKLYVKQVSGYIIYPTEVTTSLNVLRCSEYGWQIP